MSCGGGKPNFRLLDAYVGWDAYDAASSNLNGFDDPSGIELMQEDPNAADAAGVIGRLLPSRLAKGCGGCEWYLLTPAQPNSQILHRDACQTDWAPLWKYTGEDIEEGVAIAAWRRFLAVADRASGNVQVWRQDGRRVAVIEKEAPGVIAFTQKGELLVTAATEKKIWRYGLDSRLRGSLRAELPGEANRIAVDARDGVWVVTITPEGDWELWRARWKDAAFAPAKLADLVAAFPATGIAGESKDGFCFDQPSARGFEAATCFSWCGKPLDPGRIAPPKAPRRKTHGQLLTIALDSGIPRCRWHRIQLDADVVMGTSLEIAVATTEDTSISQGDPSRDPVWSAFPAGPPHPTDWTALTDGALDRLIDQPPGRFLYLRVRFVGNGASSPVVRRIRIDFPRVTSLERLPEVYRENPQAEDFTERFLSLFDASIDELDRVITRYPALLDPTGVPDQVLPWLAGFFAIALDPTWTEATTRKVLQNAPALYRLRGTPAGLQKAVELVFGVTPALQESSPTGPWGAVGSRAAICVARSSGSVPAPSVRRTARLGRVRLFGTSRVRFRVGRSALGTAPLRSHGNPDQDPFSDGAYRVQVVVPPVPNDSPEQRARLLNLINAQKPAHTVASLRVGGTGFWLGLTSAVGVDTVFAPFARPRLGSAGNVRLNRNTILWNGARGKGISVGENNVVGVQTIAG